MSSAFSCYALSWRNIATLAHTTQDVVRSPLTIFSRQMPNFRPFRTKTVKFTTDPSLTAHIRYREARSHLGEDFDPRVWQAHVAPATASHLKSLRTPSASSRSRWCCTPLFRSPEKARAILLFCLLSSVFCLLSSVFCLLSSVFCLLSSVFCLLSSAFCFLFSTFRFDNSLFGG